MMVKFPDRLTLDKSEQFANALVPIDVTLFGIITLDILVLFSNALFPIAVTV